MVTLEATQEVAAQVDIAICAMGIEVREGEPIKSEVGHIEIVHDADGGVFITVTRGDEPWAGSVNVTVV